MSTGVSIDMEERDYAVEREAYKSGYEQGKRDAVVHGRWEWDADGETGHNVRRCSRCGFSSGWAFECCPGCGARMDAQEGGNK